jgi:predicted HicB family RNase H-like nuclease
MGCSMKKKNKSKTIQIRVTEEEYDRFLAEAESLGVSLSTYVRLKTRLGIKKQMQLGMEQPDEQ